MSEKKMLFSGTISGSLESLKQEIRKDPAKPELRTYLFQLLCIAGDYERAMTQLNIAADMDDMNKLMAGVCRPLLNCEALREEIFNGRHSPLIFGEPEAWIGQMIQALTLDGKKEHKAAKQMRQKALELAEPVAGTINQEPFEWIADADSRLGPILEIIVEGKFYFTALSNIKKLEIAPPCDLRDVLWLPVSVVWKNDGQSVGFIPARYQGSVESKENAVLLGRKTIWNEVYKDVFWGLGQRMLATEKQDYPIMDVREVIFNH
jgi:type VI secretion system protein ImpE